MKLAFLASNRGSALRAIYEAIAVGDLHAEPVLNVSNKPLSQAICFASEKRIRHEVIPTRSDPGHADLRLRDTLVSVGADLVILSGYLRKVGPATLDHYAGRILNTHPSLLPKFGGGGNVRPQGSTRRSGQAGETLTGVTIHLVDKEYDQGPIVAQKAVEIGDAVDVDDVERRVLAAEGELFVETLACLASGAMTLQPEAGPWRPKLPSIPGE